MYDEPFAGLDPISLGTAARLIRHAERCLGLTSIVVSHDLEETFRVADQVIILGAGGVAAQGTPAEVMANPDPLVQQFVHAQPHWAGAVSLPGAQFGAGFWRPRMTTAAARRACSTRGASGGPGQATRLFGATAGLRLPATLARFRLVSEQIDF